jgi:Uma2 family endonuclease
MGVAVNVTDTDIVTVEQFEKLDLPGGLEWELHNGRVVSSTFPDWTHKTMQLRIAALLEAALAKAPVLVVVMTEAPWSVGDRDDHCADVAVLTVHQNTEALKRDRLREVPKLVVEVVSRSNRPYKLAELQDLVLTNGGREFWCVYPQRGLVTVARRDDLDRCEQAEYTLEDRIPLNMFGLSTGIPVREIFSGILG